MKRRKKILGVALIIFGITGIILPVIPGWIFILIGFEMMHSQSKRKCTY